MPKEIVAIMGSPHLRGNIHHALTALLDGARQNGANVKRYDLCQRNIKNCTGCRKCIENGGCCVLKDDMEEIFTHIKSADVVIIASPIYICQVNGYVKILLDRLYPLTDTRHKPRFGTRRLVMLYTYGAPVPLVFGKYIRYTGKSLKAMGLILQKNIVIHGCTTIDKVKTDKKRLTHLFQVGTRL